MNRDKVMTFLKKSLRFLPDKSYIKLYYRLRVGRKLNMSILEGMATGKAIISTTVGAIPEVVKEENGILIQPGDVQALADALVKCSTNLKMLEDMSQKNINKIYEQFSMKSMHLKLMSYYKQVIKNG